jgi:hypothetical protein
MTALTCLRLLFWAAHAQMVSMGATILPLNHKGQHDLTLSQGIALPEVDIFLTRA